MGILYSKVNIDMTLEKTNEHPRDSRIDFIEESHTYLVDGSKDGYISTTTLMHSLFKPFDPDEVIDKIMRSRNWVNSIYFGQSPDDIKTGWEKIGI